MSKQNIAVVSIVVLLIIGLGIWMSQREEQAEQVAEEDQVEEIQEGQEEEADDGDDIPAEFEDNLDEAFEDLDAVDL